jgi:hypothetical protein
MTELTPLDYLEIVEKSTEPNGFYINLPKQSSWTCYAFGGDAGFSPITWTPQEGKVPNAWVRFWMKVFFDCNWVKNK